MRTRAARRRARRVLPRHRQSDRGQGRARHDAGAARSSCSTCSIPHDEPGRLTLIHRFGARAIADGPAAAGRGGRARAGRRVLWVCDPMHGNTETTPQRLQDAPLRPHPRRARAGVRRSTSDSARYLGGVHFELTGENVTECIGGARGLAEADLARAYRSQVDPRLNYEQALEMAMRIARRMAAAARGLSRRTAAVQRERARRRCAQARRAARRSGRSTRRRRPGGVLAGERERERAAPSGSIGDDPDRRGGGTCGERRRPAARGERRAGEHDAASAAAASGGSICADLLVGQGAEEQGVAARSSAVEEVDEPARAAAGLCAASSRTAPPPGELERSSRPGQRQAATPATIAPRVERRPAGRGELARRRRTAVATFAAWWRPASGSSDRGVARVAVVDPQPLAREPSTSSSTAVRATSGAASRSRRRRGLLARSAASGLGVPAASDHRRPVASGRRRPSRGRSRRGSRRETRDGRARSR